jgi:hypothetical protein
MLERPDRDRSPTSGPSMDSGSVLIEALAGISMLAFVVASAAVVHSAAVTAVVGAEGREAAVRTAERSLEQRAAGLPVETGGVALEVLRTPADGDPCSGSAGAGQAALRVRVPVGTHGEVVELLGPLPERSVDVAWSTMAPGGNAVLVRLRTGLPEPIGAVLLQPGAQGTPHELVPSALCFSAPEVAPGRAELTIAATTGPVLIDASHRPADEAPLPLSVLDRTVRTTWSLMQSALVTVDVDPGGARPPDVAYPAGLGWTVRGDDLLLGVGLGQSRPIHPGRVTIGISACADPEARASVRTFDVAPGEVLSLGVPLAIVEVQGVQGRSGATLELLRATACSDESRQVPSLLWHGGLSDGMRVALPHGGWDVALYDSSGKHIGSAPRVMAGEPDQVLVLQ